MLDYGSVYTHLATGWATAIARACWQGSLALLLAWVICRLPRLSPRVQCWVWRLAYLKLLVTLFWVRPIDLPVLPAPSSPAPVVLPYVALRTPRTDAESPLPASLSGATPYPARDLTSVWEALFVLWMAGSLWYGLRAAWDWRNIRRLRASCRPLDDPHYVAICRELCAGLELDQCPALLLQEGVGYPQLVGGLHPAIILPQSFWEGCTEAQQRLILTHELAHVRRRDLLWAWIPLLGRCLFFFLPPVWFAEREWQQSQEIACDEQVLRLAASSRSEYGNVLLKIALLPRPELTSGLIAVRIAESYSVVQRRLLAMKHAGKTSRRALVAAGVMLTAVGVTGIVPWRVSAQDVPKKEKQANAELVRRKLAFGEVGLAPDVAVQLQLNEAQMRRAQEIATAGAHQVMQLLTPVQQQMVMPKGTGLSDVLAFLNLTDAQKIKIKTLMIEQEKQLRAIEEDETLTKEESVDAVKRISQQGEERWTQVLTPAQREQMGAIIKQRQQEEDWLHLTDAQKARMVELKRNLGAQIQALGENETMPEAERKARMETLTRGMKEQYLQILTPEQRQLAAAHEEQQRANREVGPFHLVNLERVDNLAPEQRGRIQAVYTAVEQQFEQILTAAQKQKLQQVLRARSKSE